MGPSLAALPAELLLNIIENEKEHSAQQLLLTNLRGTCVKINKNIKFYWGSKCLSQVRSRLQEEDLARLQVISEDPLGVHVHSITIVVDTLIEKGLIARHTDTREVVKCDLASEMATLSMNMHMELPGSCLNETVAAFILGGSCKRVLSAALTGFSRLKSLRIEPPHFSYLQARKVVEDTQRIWLVASKVLLNVAFTQTPTLDELILWQTSGHPYKRSIPMSLSALEVAALDWPKWCPSVRKLQLSLAIECPGCALGHANYHSDRDRQRICLNASNSMNGRLLNTFLQTLTGSNDLRLSLYGAGTEHLTPITQALPSVALQTLVICGGKLSFESLALFFAQSQGSLQRLTLYYFTFYEYKDFEELLELFMRLPNLEECTFEALNTTVVAIHFHKINEMRPCTRLVSSEALDASAWVYIMRDSDECKIDICADEGDDVKHWLRMILLNAYFETSMWDREDLLYIQ